MGLGEAQPAVPLGAVGRFLESEAVCADRRSSLISSPGRPWGSQRRSWKAEWWPASVRKRTELRGARTGGRWIDVGTQLPVA